MAAIDNRIFDLGQLDSLSRGDSEVHRLDARAKLVTTLAFVATVVSFGKYEVSALAPLAAYPIFLIAAGALPPGPLVRRVIVLSPLAVMLGMFNPFFDRSVALCVGPVEISGGWLSFSSIIGRFILTVLAALTLVAVTGFHNLCGALARLGVPRAMVMQLMFLYRYLFVLTDEAARMSRARALRTFNGAGFQVRIFGSMVGHLLLRTLDRAQRIQLAMNCRGFDGTVRIANPARFGRNEVAFTVLWLAYFAVVRLYHLPRLIGDLVTGVLS